MAARKKSATAAPALRTSLRWGGAEFAAWMLACGLTRQRAALLLGVHLATIYRVIQDPGPIPRMLQLACEGYAALDEDGRAAVARRLGATI